MISVTTLVLTYNEEENIARTLESLCWGSSVIVVDSESTDSTVESARSFPNVQLHQRPFDTHAQQWNHGLSLIETEWVLALDADYVVSRELVEEIQVLAPPPDVIGYLADFRYVLFGQPLRASIYPPRIILFRARQGRYVDEGHTQRLRFSDASVGKLAASPTETGGGTTRKLSGKILHDDRKPLSRWIRSQDRYANLEARYLVEGGRRKDEGGSGNRLSPQDKLRKMIFVAPMVMPVYLLFGRGLIFDGWRGWYYVFQRTIAELLLSLRLLERKLKE